MDTHPPTLVDSDRVATVGTNTPRIVFHGYAGALFLLLKYQSVKIADDCPQRGAQQGSNKQPSHGNVMTRQHSRRCQQAMTSFSQVFYPLVPDIHTCYKKLLRALQSNSQGLLCPEVVANSVGNIGGECDADSPKMPAKESGKGLFTAIACHEVHMRCLKLVDHG